MCERAPSASALRQRNPFAVVASHAQSCITSSSPFFSPFLRSSLTQGLVRQSATAQIRQHETMLIVSHTLCQKKKMANHAFVASSRPPSGCARSAVVTPFLWARGIRGKGAARNIPFGVGSSHKNLLRYCDPQELEAVVAVAVAAVAVAAVAPPPSKTNRGITRKLLFQSSLGDH